MAGNKRPRKGYKRKPCVKPLGIRDNALMEIPGLMASTLLGNVCFTDTHLADLISHADMVKRLATDAAMRRRAEAILDACAAIQAREATAGHYGVAGDELRAIRDNIGATMDFLRSVPNVDIWRAAQAALAEFDRHGGLRIKRLAA
jgi:hypothetical protein